MKKVLLVDDEILIRETIRDTIQWEKEGLFFCGDASDGELALPMIEQFQPDILITDIKMPFMDGLELSSIVRKNRPDIKIVILSGHSEFDYARSALRIGVDEYCIKPISSADLIQTLHQVSEKIDKERQEKEQLEQQQQQSSLTVSNLLNDLCSGFIPTSEAIHLSSKLNLNLLARYYIVVTADFRKLEHSNTPQEDMTELMDLGKDRFPFSTPTSDHILMFKRSKTEFVWIVKGESPEQLKQDLVPYQHFQNQPITDSPSLMSIGIGRIQDRMQGIHISFLEAMEDMYWRRLSRQNRHSLFEYNSGSLEQSIFLDRTQFIEFLKLGSPANVIPFIRSFASVLQSMDWHSSLIGYYILNDLTLEVFRSARSTYTNIEHLASPLQSLQRRIETIHSWEDSCAYLIQLVEQYWSWRSDASDKYGNMLIKVKKYIHENYDKQDFSLQDAADHVNLSAGHLSKVFSHEIGQTFIEYLTHTRINRAMELLQTTHAKSYEIADRVGYNDAHYFSNLFKRVTGMTTKQFRQQGQISKQLPTPNREEQ